MMNHKAFVFQPSHCTDCKDPFHAVVLGAEMQLEHSQVILAFSSFTSYVCRCCLNTCLPLAMETSGVMLLLGFFLSRHVALLPLFPLYLRNVQFLSLVPPMPRCMGQEMAARITGFLFLSSIILISDFLDNLQPAHLLVKFNACTESETVWCLCCPTYPTPSY